MDGFGPIQALNAAALYRENILGLDTERIREWKLVFESRDALQVKDGEEGEYDGKEAVHVCVEKAYLC